MRPRRAATTGLVGLLLAVVLSILGLGLGATVGVAGAETVGLAPGTTVQDAGVGPGHASVITAYPY